MRIALDAMGGDRGVESTVPGAVAAARELGLDVILVGQPGPIEAALSLQGGGSPGLSIVAAEQTIDMDDHPAEAIRQKPRASMVKAMELVRDGAADAFVTAGNSGAALAAALFRLGRMPEVDRPALAIVIPTVSGQVCIIDVGANVDARPECLAQFGLMGSVYMQRLFGVSSPRVATLSIGEEQLKANAQVRAAQPYLSSLPINYVGNVEGKDIPFGAVDVVVCDGFVGNIVLKLVEGVASAVSQIMRAEIMAGQLTRLAALALTPAFKRVRRRLDYAEYGGAQLLGVNGLCVIAHGRSSPVAISNSLRVAAEAVRYGVVEAIREGLAPLAAATKPT